MQTRQEQGYESEDLVDRQSTTRSGRLSRELLGRLWTGRGAHGSKPQGEEAKGKGREGEG